MKNYGIQVTLALPPDTDTPGYANENKSKPLETKLISETANLLTPEDVGNKILQDTLVIFKMIVLNKNITKCICLGWKIF